MDLEITQQDDSTWSGVEACAVAIVVRKRSGCTREASRWCDQGAISVSGWPRASSKDGLSYSEEHYYYADLRVSQRPPRSPNLYVLCPESGSPKTPKRPI